MNPLITPEQAIAVALIFTRIIAFFLSFPFLNSTLIPLNIRILLIVALSFYTMSIFNIQISIKEIDMLVLFLLVIKELFIGFSLGIITNIFIAAFSFASEILSYLMGFTVVNMFDPSFGQISVLDRLFILLFYLLFFITGSYAVFIGGLMRSFEIMPITEFKINEGIFEFIIQQSSNIFILAFQIAFPFVIILMIINIVLAMINRLIPQINVFIVGLPLQIFVGFLALMFGSWFLVYISVHLLERLTDIYLNIIKIMGR